MPFSLRSIIVVPVLALALVAAGCGGDGETGAVPEDAVAVVGDREIAKADYDRLLKQAESTFKARKQEFPAAGTAEFEQLKNAIVKSLVEQAQFEQGAEELGIEVSDKAVDKRLEELKQQFFQGDEKKYKAELKKQGLTERQVRDDIRSRLLSELIFKEVTKGAKVTDAEVEAYYAKNESDFATPSSRDVRHILVKKKAKANQIYRQLRGGADFAKLAKKFSEDPSSKDKGGKLTAQKGQTVKPFDRTVFALDTGELSKPVKTQFGWHIIEALSAVKPKSVKPLSEVEKDIRSQLLQQKQNTTINEWVENLKKRFADQISYAPGYKPPKEQATTGTTTSGTATNQ